MTAIHDMTAGELLAAYKTKKLSPVEAVDAVIARIEAWEPKLKALYAPDFGGARKAAKESEKRWQAGKPQGALDGVPITIKENIATKGVPVPLGTAATELVPAAADAPAAARVREAGAIILAKTTMPDYGMLSSGRSSFHPLTRNPWNLAWNPGGSSAGAGAAAAAGYGPLHLGTDIGGSVRLPATWNGIFTLKPSLGRVPVDPPYFGRAVGPMTRTVADSALLLAELSKPDCARPHEPAAGRHRLGRRPARAQGPEDRPASRRRLGPAGRCRSEGGGRSGGQGCSPMPGARSSRWRRSCRPRCCICRISSGGCGAGSISPR